MSDIPSVTSPLTGDQLEAAGYPRDFNSLTWAQQQEIMTDHAARRDNAAQIKFYEDTAEYDQYADRYQKAAKLAVMGSYNSTHEVPDQLEIEQLYIVWFAKVLKNWKALISTSVPGDRLYFEVTYNGNPGREETYVDTYRKEDNQIFSNHD